MRLFTAFVFFLFVSVCDAQVMFQKTYGGIYWDEAFCVSQTNDRGYIIVGQTSSFGAGPNDVYLLKTDSFGNVLWSNTFGGLNNDVGESVQQTLDGGFIVAGYTNSFGSPNENDIYLIKTDSLGNSLWTKTFRGINTEAGYSVVQDVDEGYSIAGYTDSFGDGGLDVYLIKTDANGDTLWTKTYGGAMADGSYFHQQTLDRGYIITGRTKSFGAGAYDVYLIKTDSSGNLLWSKTYGGPDNEWGYSIKQSIDGGYIIVGYTSSFGAGLTDAYLIKTDNSGNLLWSKTYGEINNEWGYSVQQTSDTGFIVAGRTVSFGTHQSQLIKTDSIGNLLWSKGYGNFPAGVPVSIQQCGDGGFAIVGSMDSSVVGNNHIFFIKTDINGITGCSDSSFTIITGLAATQVTSPLTIVSASACTIFNPATIINNVLFANNLCTIVGINEMKAEREIISIIPNPATNEFTIKNAEFKIKAVEIYDVLGEKIFSKDVTAGNADVLTINTAEFNSGIYFVSIKTAGGIVAKKLVVQK